MQTLLINGTTPWQAAATAIIGQWRFRPCLRVSVTGACNMGCRFCHNDGSPKQKGSLPVSFYRDLAQQAIDVRLRAVKLTGGEPTLRQDLPEIVSAFSSAGFEDISLISNGIHLTPQLQMRLKHAGLDRVTVSVHTLEPARYERQMRIPAANLQRTLNNLEHAATVFPGDLKLNSVFTPGANYPGEVVDLVRLACSLNATLSVLSVVSKEVLTPTISTGVRSIVQQFFHVREITSTSKRGVRVETLVLAEGGAVELDDFRAEDALAARDANAYCRACPVKRLCTEGPYALRVTSDGRLKPCLIRKDNECEIN